MLLNEIKSAFRQHRISHLSFDSKKIKKQGCFLAGPGIQRSGTEFVDEAFSNGAELVLAHQPIKHKNQNKIICLEQWKNLIADVVIGFYGKPELPVFAVTGTNGKTTVSHLIAQFWDLLHPNSPCGLIGTVGCGTIRHLKPQPHTTPDLITVCETIQALKETVGIAALSMEASSHALDQNRLLGLPIKYGIFTNLSHEHLDYHHDLDNYAKAKSCLFQAFELDAAIFNLDDPWGLKFYQGHKAWKIGYGFDLPPTAVNEFFRAQITESSLHGTGIQVRDPLGQLHVCRTPLVGRFNISNLLAALSALWAAGFSMSNLIEQVPHVKPIVGRFELTGSRPHVIVDYAHTPEALEKVAQAIQESCDFSKTDNSRLILVFGCGGNRDRSKRPVMGKLAAQYAEAIIVTQDNSRNETFDAISQDILQGLTAQDLIKCSLVPNRKTAIFKSIALANHQDVVLIAGRGHETEQIIRDQRLAFSDQQASQEAMQNIQRLKAEIQGPAGHFQVDSRKIQPGDIFVALQGQLANGHDFVRQAFEKGARAALVKDEYTFAPCVPEFEERLIRCPDPAALLFDLAKWYRHQFQIPFVGITGSQGKTTVKYLLVHMLSAIIGPNAVHFTVGNLNTDIGVPISLFELNAQHACSIIEMGARKTGDVRLLTQLVRPQVTLINNIGSAHIEIFGSRSKIAEAKSEIHEGLPENGVAVVNADDECAPLWLSDLARKGVQVLTFGINNKATIQAEDIHLLEQKSEFYVQGVRMQLPLPGEHNVRNALAAMAIAQALGFDLSSVQKSLASVRPVEGRLVFHQGHNHSLIIDDTYNASFDAVKSAIDVLSQQTTHLHKYFVFGGMLELGAYSQAYHQEIGSYAKKQGIDRVLTWGPDAKQTAEAFGQAAQHFEHKLDLINDLKNYLDKQSAVLIKGARGAKMEEVVKELLC